MLSPLEPTPAYFRGALVMRSNRCPRCGGCAMRLDLITDEDTIKAQRCLNCGAVFGEPLLDHHHQLDRPPAPWPDANTPT